MLNSSMKQKFTETDDWNVQFHAICEVDMLEREQQCQKVCRYPQKYDPVTNIMKQRTILLS